MNTFNASKQPGKTIQKELAEKTLLNVHYGKDSLQIMDIYLPKDRSVHSTKSLILIHGGGWVHGSKSEFITHIESFKTRLPDYAVFNLNYRLVGGGHLFPTQEQDIKLAVDFIVAHAEEYHINIDNLVLLGVSAGAHLALLQAYKQPSPKIKAVVDYFGPTDLLTMYQKPWHPLVPLALQMVTGTSPEKEPQLFHASSPIEFVTPQAPPTLILHGAKDEVVNVSQSKALTEKLSAAGVKNHLEIYPAERHGRWYGQALTSSFDHIENFLTQNVS